MLNTYLGLNHGSEKEMNKQIIKFQVNSRVLLVINVLSTVILISKSRQMYYGSRKYYKKKLQEQAIPLLPLQLFYASKIIPKYKVNLKKITLLATKMNQDHCIIFLRLKQ